MAGKQLDAVVELFRAYSQQQNWSILEKKLVQNGLQLLITDGEGRTPVVCFTNGNALIQGATSPLKTHLKTWWEQQKTLALPLQQEIAQQPPAMQKKIDAFSEYAREQGWSYTGKKMHQGIYQLRFTHQTTTVPINFYPTGTVLIQGNPSDLKQHIEQWWISQQGHVTTAFLWENASISEEEPHKETTVSQPQPVRTNGPITAHIGTDEAGKGDYFGALVVAGVYVNEQTDAQLRAVGVRDSKLLSDTAILSMAEGIKRIYSPRHYHVIAYQPAQYNRLYQEIQNLNFLLAKAHTQIIHTLQKETGCQLALVDQFGPEALLLQTLQSAACPITLEQRPRAEEDVAVAAASILARAEFVQQLAKLSKYARTELPKGASNPDIIVVGRAIVAQFGQDMLRKLAKLHFKTTQAILQEY